MNAVAQLTLRQMLGGGRVWFSVLLLALPALLLLALRLASGFAFEDEVLESYLMTLAIYMLYPQSMCILLCLLHGTSLFATEIESKTLVYLLTHAEPRWRVLLAKYAATAVALAALSMASLTVSFLIAGAPLGIHVFAGLSTAVVGACIAYTALFALIGLLVPNRAIAVGLLYAVVLEVVLSFVPALVNEVTASYYLRSLAFHIGQIDLSALAEEDLGPLPRLFAGAGVLRSLASLLAITAVALACASAWFHKKEYPLSE